MGIFSKLFGSEKVIDKGMDAIDSIWHTEEEKAEDRLTKAKLKLEFRSFYHPYKLAQRIMMIFVAGAFVGIHLICAIAWLVCVFVFWGNSEVYDFIATEIPKIMGMNNDALGLPFIIIVGFYFGAGELDVSKWINIGKKK